MKCPTNANGTVTKIGTSSVGTDLRPIKLVNGVPTAVSNDFVSTSGDQNIANKKTFTGQIWAQNTIRLDPQSDIRRGIVFLTSNNHAEQYLIGKNYDSSAMNISYVPSLLKLMEWAKDGAVTVPNQRTYSASNTSDIVTIGTLQASTDVVHTSGNESITGVKTFQSALMGSTIVMKTVDLDVTSPGTSSKYTNAITWVDKNGVGLVKLWVVQSSNGQIKLGCDIKNSDNTWKFGQILAQGDVI